MFANFLIKYFMEKMNGEKYLTLTTTLFTLAPTSPFPPLLILLPYMAYRKHFVNFNVLEG